MKPPSAVNSVLFVTYHFPPEIGGIHTRISHYVKELRRRGVVVTVFVITTRGKEVKKGFDHAVAANPVKAVAIAAGVGLLIGWLWRRN